MIITVDVYKLSSHFVKHFLTVNASGAAMPRAQAKARRQPRSMDMPDVDDDVWFLRMSKRQAAIDVIHNTPEYVRAMQLITEARARAARLGNVCDLAMPPEPDPSARTPKRTHEIAVMNWRKALKAIADLDEVPVSV